jgi:flagellar basal-body rod protein FlgG
MTERGERYTRDGSFTINQDGVLMTHNGNPVMGEKGIIVLQKHNFMINEKGDVVVNNEISRDAREMVNHDNNSWNEPVVLDRLKIVDFENIREIKKEGDSMYRSTDYSGPAVPPTGELKVVQGFLEKSNVNIVREMVDMIEVQRAYEANQKTVMTHDQELGRLINDVAR